MDYLAALSPLKRLRKFTFDHPWEAPRDWPFPDPDGRTIRSERNGDFRVISCMGGKTIAEEMRDRVCAFLFPSLVGLLKRGSVLVLA